ncbi:MAG: ABC transporter permease [Nitrososphaerota archaeon]
MELLPALLTSTLSAGTILLLAALGEAYAERAGVLNLGVEGTMALGGLASFVAALQTGNPYLGLLAGLGAGLALGLLHSLLSVSLRANQVVSGLGVTLLGIGLSGFLGKAFVGLQAPRLPSLQAPGAGGPLGSLGPWGSVLANALMGESLPVYLAWALAPLLWFLLVRTRWGLIVRAVGEDPAMADGLGYNVALVRYACTCFGGAMAGLAGGYLILGYLGGWAEGSYSQPITEFRGFIALGLVILAAWSPLRLALFSYAFGALGALSIAAQGFLPGASPQLLLALPYLATLAALAVVSYEPIRRRVGPPAALGKPYFREG